MISNKRARQILESYGGNSEQWPSDERLSLQQLILSDSELQILQQQELQFDNTLTKTFAEIEQLDTQQLQQTILDNLPNRDLKTSSTNNKAYPNFISVNISRIISRITQPAWSMTIATTVIIITIGVFQMDRLTAPLPSNNIEDELLLMAEALDNADEFELFAVLEPELFEESSDLL